MDAPFPYFGVKKKAAGLVWSRFGEVKNYVEPFCGSLAMLLNAPYNPKISTVNDADGFVANFWRAVKEYPESVAHWADYPVVEADLEARHAWLVNRKEKLVWSLQDPDFYDTKIAGWWVWGLCAWIGDGFCEGKSKWGHNGVEFRIVDKEGIRRKLPHVADAVMGINRKLPCLSSRGINRQIPHIGNAGQGINKGKHESRLGYITDMFKNIQGVIRDTRIINGDWKRCVTNSVTTGHGLTAVFLDPPYAEGNMDYAVGGVGTKLDEEVRLWCIENHDNPLLRIVLCGHDGDHDELLGYGFTKSSWKAGSGYAKSQEANERRKSEVIYFSKSCLGE